MKTKRVTVKVDDARAIKLLKELQEMKIAFKKHIKETGSSADFKKRLHISK